MYRRLMLGYLLAVFTASGCSEGGDAIIIYVSHDRDLSERILKAFERKEGIAVKSVYDAEANKTTGLVNRLIAEGRRPRADVFWNNEVLRTVQLERKGLLARLPPIQQPRPVWDDAHGRWAGFAGRMRVLVVNTNLGRGAGSPAGLEDFVHPRWRGRAAFADPHFGTTGTHFAVLRQVWGAERFRRWLRACRENDVRVLPGNAQVRDAVAAGRFAFGLTDTDDVNAALEEGRPVRMVIPDQGGDGLGTLLIPNTVMVLRGRPANPAVGRLVNYLLSEQVEAALAAGRGAQYPLRHVVKGPPRLPALRSVRVMAVDMEAAARGFEPMLADFEAVFRE